MTPRVTPKGDPASYPIAIESRQTSSRETIAHLHDALRVSPRDPMRHNFYQQLTMACLCDGDYVDCVEYARRGQAHAPDIAQLHGMLAMNLVGLGEIEKAKDGFIVLAAQDLSI